MKIVETFQRLSSIHLHVSLVLIAICCVKTASSYCHYGCSSSNMYDPVCGTDRETYNNICMLRQAACLSRTRIGVAYVGECLTGAYDPICGTNGVTYRDDCELHAAECRSNKTIPIFCRGECLKIGRRLTCRRIYIPTSRPTRPTTRPRGDTLIGLFEE